MPTHKIRYTNQITIIHFKFQNSKHKPNVSFTLLMHYYYYYYYYCSDVFMQQTKCQFHSFDALHYYYYYYYYYYSDVCLCMLYLSTCV